MALRGYAGAMAAMAVLSFAAPSSAAGAVLGPTGGPAAREIDVQLAVAITPFGTTRWARLAEAGASHAMWLLPVRPGAAVDLANDGWLDALDEATAPRVVAPDGTPPCGMPFASERTPAYARGAVGQAPSSVAVLSTESALRRYVASRGFSIPTPLDARIASLYANGDSLVAVELTGDGAIASPTVRISDDGAPALPLALTGADADVRLSVVTIGSSAFTVPGATRLGAASLVWNMTGSTFASARDGLLAGPGPRWLVESASHEAIEGGVDVPRASPILSVPAVLTTSSACTSRARTVTDGVVGRSCASGAVARVPGGAPCVGSLGDVDPATLACGAGGDLALALAGLSYGSVVATRLSGFIPKGTVGSDVALTTALATTSPLVTAAGYAACPSAMTKPKTRPERSAPSTYVTSGGCDGDTTLAVAGEDTTSDEPSSDGDDQDADGGSAPSEGDTATSDDGEPSEARSSGSEPSSDAQDDSCSSSQTESSSESSSSNDSCSNSMKVAASNVARRRRSRSPMSRVAMASAFLLLPLRRRFRGDAE